MPMGPREQARPRGHSRRTPVAARSASFKRTPSWTIFRAFQSTRLPGSRRYFCGCQPTMGASITALPRTISGGGLPLCRGGNRSIPVM